MRTLRLQAPLDQAEEASCRAETRTQVTSHPGEDVIPLEQGPCSAGCWDDKAAPTLRFIISFSRSALYWWMCQVLCSLSHCIRYIQHTGTDWVLQVRQAPGWALGRQNQKANTLAFLTTVPPWEWTLPPPGLRPVLKRPLQPDCKSLKEITEIINLPISICRCSGH